MTESRVNKRRADANLARLRRRRLLRDKATSGRAAKLAARAHHRASRRYWRQALRNEE